MNIVSTAEIRKDLQKDLEQSFPETFFIFHKNIEEAMADLATAEVCITYGEDFTLDILEKCQALKWIMVISAGVEEMPLQEIKERDILITNAKGIHKIPMAEYTMGMILQYIKDLPVFLKRQENKEWNQSGNMSELAGKTITIPGPGAIGSEIARLAKAFRMTTIGINKSGRNVEHIDHIFRMDQLSEAVKDSDIVVSVLPFTKETDHILDQQFFNSMKNDALFINIGRGKTVVQEDLVNAIKSNEIGHAILDVFEQEPLPTSHPFWEMPNVTLTPHISSHSSEYQPRSLQIFKDNLVKYINQQDDFINVIDPDRGY